MQLGKVLSIHTKFKVCCYTGDMNVDAWDKKTWNDEFYKYEVNLNQIVIIIIIIIVIYFTGLQYFIHLKV